MSKVNERDLCKMAIDALEDMADEEDLEAILYLCKKNINRDTYLQKLEKMLKMEDSNATARRHIAKTIYEITGDKLKELNDSVFKQVNIDK